MFFLRTFATDRWCGRPSALCRSDWQSPAAPASGCAKRSSSSVSHPSSNTSIRTRTWPGGAHTLKNSHFYFPFFQVPCAEGPLGGSPINVWVRPWWWDDRLQLSSHAPFSKISSWSQLLSLKPPNLCLWIIRRWHGSPPLAHKHTLAHSVATFLFSWSSWSCETHKNYLYK